MDDLVKLVGLALLLGATIIAAMMGWTIVHNEAMMWFIVVTTQTSVIVCAGAFTLVVLYRVVLALSTLVSRSIEERLTSARVLRTAPDPQHALPGSDQAALITAMFGGVPAHDAVEGVWKVAPQEEDHDQ